VRQTKNGWSTSTTPQRPTGPFCGCGDYSCPANDNENARCVNNDHFVPVEFTYDLD
jgi:hypothetical protein